MALRTFERLRFTAALGVEKSELNAVNRIPDYLSDVTDRAKGKDKFP